jgi:hypothetical protein
MVFPASARLNIEDFGKFSAWRLSPMSQAGGIAALSIIPDAGLGLHGSIARSLFHGGSRTS